MNRKQWLAFLESLEGFNIHQGAALSKNYAELYKYNFATIQVLGIGFLQIDSIEVHVFFDSEARASRDNSVTRFTIDKLAAVKIFIQTQKTKYNF